jgi:signal peptidase I, bacterial type
MKGQNIKSRTTIRWGKILLIAFILSLVLRFFFVESYRMSSDRMATAIERGDFLLTDKTAYGIRLPDAIPSFPFFPDSIKIVNKRFPLYFSIPPVHFKKKNPERNDIAVYHIPGEFPGPTSKRPVSISRCVGLPGDTIEINGADCYINGDKISYNPDLTLLYEYDSLYGLSVRNAMKELKIPVRLFRDGTDNLLYLSHYERYLIEDKLSVSGLFLLQGHRGLAYKLIIPKEGMIVKLSPSSMNEYGPLILKMESNAEIKNGILYLDGKHTEYYKFPEDCYWFLSDNPDISADSRHFGFVPHSHLIGKVQRVWLSKDPDKSLFGGYNPDRFFIKVR